MHPSVQLNRNTNQKRQVEGAASGCVGLLQEDLRAGQQEKADLLRNPQAPAAQRLREII